MQLSPGEIIDDKYRIVRLLGEGGMGAVYEGENTRIHRRVAIKVLHASVAGMADAVARFEREAQAAGRIGSDHIVEVLDLGTLASGDRYMVMEFMDGDTLSQRIRQRGRLAPTEVLPLMQQLLDALGAAHNAGIVHRDLKPDNVFLLRSRRGNADFVKLLDFGISKFGSGPSALSMTRTGAVMGTPYYMAPEQARGAKDLDARVDLYAVGVILYEALTGQVPFSADTFNELLFKIVLEKPRPLEELVPEIDPGFVAIVSRAMARERDDRFQTAEALQVALEQWARGLGHVVAAATMPTAVRQGVEAVGPPTVAASFGTPPAAFGTTPGNWANASAVAEPPASAPVLPMRRPSGALWGGVAAAVLLAGGVGVFALSGSDEAVADPKVAAASAVGELPATASAPPVVATATPPSAARVDVLPVPTPPKPVVSAAPVSAPVVAAKPPAAVARPAVQAPIVKKPAAAASAAAPAGRKIRTSL